MLTLKQMKYICKNMMGVDWVPSIGDERASEVLRIMDLCQSKLEMMYLLGVGYHLYRYNIDGRNEDYPWLSVGKLENGQPGIWFFEPWSGYCRHCGNGPSALMLVPQYKSPEKDIHHDFGIFTASENGGGPPWHFWCAVEIDGYGVHKNRRNLDISRDTGLSYKLARISEETVSPLEWFETIVDCPCQSFDN
ncbi:MAG: hypothetical protein KJ077_07625 [Anaerolineae bacterium]|nr:hypothetical protein [Anaerolineae bacterium]